MPKLTALPLFLLSAALAGGAGPAPARTQTVQAPAIQAPKVQALEVWEGRYTCADGVVGARLSILEWTGDTFKLLGELYPVSSRPAAPRGRAEVWGSLSGDLSSGTIHLKEWRWQVQPRGYDLATISARYALGGDYRRINLTFEANAFGCTVAEFSRVK